MYKRILVPYDGSRSAKRALREATSLAKEQQARLRVVYVLEEMPWQISCTTFPIDVGAIEESWMEAGQETLIEADKQVKAAGYEADTQLIETLTEPPTDAVVEEARQWQADLIVMGTHGRRGLSRMFMGSVAEGVVRQATMPVLLVHDAEAD